MFRCPTAVRYWGLKTRNYPRPLRSQERRSSCSSCHEAHVRLLRRYLGVGSRAQGPHARNPRDSAQPTEYPCLAAPRILRVLKGHAGFHAGVLGRRAARRQERDKKGVCFSPASVILLWSRSSRLAWIRFTANHHHPGLFSLLCPIHRTQHLLRTTRTGHPETPTALIGACSCFSAWPPLFLVWPSLVHR